MFYMLMITIFLSFIIIVMVSFYLVSFSSPFPDFKQKKYQSIFVFFFFLTRAAAGHSHTIAACLSLTSSHHRLHLTREILLLRSP